MIESKEESSANSMSLIILRMWRFQFEDRYKSDTTFDLFKERLKILGKVY